MARYGQAFRDRIVARLLPPESAAIDVVSREVGVSVGTLERWRPRRWLHLASWLGRVCKVLHSPKA